MAGEIHDGLAQAFLAVIMQARVARIGDRIGKQRLLQLLGKIEDLIQSARERDGLRAMRERAEACGGSFIVERGLLRGTCIDVLLPMEKTSP
ncbi:MAG: hypothetical protein JWQ76_2434 [Ramlibacter sp.]|nr:hypothetical protein [Ramlibacter sp.]